MKKFLDNFMLVFILFIPFLYLYISYGIKIEINLEILGFILFSFFFLLIYLYLFINNVKRGMLIGYLIFMLMAIGFTFFNHLNYLARIEEVLTILYFPIMILFFSNYENKWLSKKYISYVYLIFAIILTISYIFRFNYDLALEYKKGFIGLFYGANVISPIMAILMPIALDYSSKSKNYIVKGIFYITTIISVLFLGTKTIYASLVIYLVYRIFKYFKKKPHVALIIATVLSAIVVVLPMIPQYQNFRTERIYNAVRVDDGISKEKVDAAVFGNKLGLTQDTFKHLNERNDSYNLIFGTDYEKVGIDLVDILLTIGVVGLILYIAFVIYILADTKLKGLYLILFVAIVAASFFQGNILTNYYVYIFLSLLFLLNNQKDDNKKRILLVSNMYPGNKDKSYGIFVKNVNDRLELYYTVDKAVITKHKNVISKSIAYIYLYLKTIIKMTFDNYDFIYVHFVSHSSQGVAFASHFIKDTKIIMNVHGNDIVPDRKIDNKNVKKSKKYLQYADKVVAPSDYFKDVLINEYKINEKNIVVYPSGGIDLSTFKPLDKDESKEELGLDEKTKYIGYISRIDTDKGYDTFVDAINVLSKDKKFKKYKYIIVGNGLEQNKLLHMIKKYNLQDEIIYKSSIDREDMPKLYNSLDVFVFPTRRKSDSLGLVGLEALACNTITITSDAKGPLSYMNNKKNGYVFKQDDYNDLVEKIKVVAELSDADIKKLNKNATSTVSLYDSSNMDTILKKIFK